ncbi:MAG: dehydrogenase [Planctomycetaceae bacterium]|nr:dehydrogenase [Planctomycetaceae bacterium]
MLNRRDFVALGASTAVAAMTRPAWAASANETIGLGFIGLGGQGNGLLDRFSKQPGVAVRWLCDADEARAAAAGEKHPGAQTTQDLRRVIDAEDVDAVVIATCNHWHCMAAVMAMEAGKDVYVEKPLSHNVHEGRDTVATARRLGRMVQLGTQQRSDPMQQELRKFFHETQELGPLQSVEVCRYGVRESIGKRSTPLTPPKTVDYNLWLGPAQDIPIDRDNFHYDWHWVWNTGNGEMGNWGVHLVDDVLNVAFLDKTPVPKSVQGGGGRVIWDDAGQTANVHFAKYETDTIPVVIGLSNLRAKPGENRPLRRKIVDCGYIVNCEGGYYCGWRGGGVAFDKDGKELRKFRGTTGVMEHPANFLQAVRTRNRDLLTAEVAVGDASTNWCHLANIAQRMGKAGAGSSLPVGEGSWLGTLGALQTHLEAYDLSLANQQIEVSDVLTLAEGECRFTGDHADRANEFLTRQYRAGFEWPGGVTTAAAS